MLHKDLKVYKKSIELVTSVYKISVSFPDSEKFGITSQLRRSSVSIPSKIAEGSGRKSSKEFMHFLNISLGSIAEVDTQLDICRNLDYIDVDQHKTLIKELTEIRKMTVALVKSIDKTRY